MVGICGIEPSGSTIRDLICVTSMFFIVDEPFSEQQFSAVPLEN
jgi:hypothetical protein